MRSLSRRENRSQPALAALGLLDDGRNQHVDIRQDIRAPRDPAAHRSSGVDSQATSAARENRQTTPSLRPGQLARLGQLDHDRLVDLQELAGLLGVHHLGRVVGLEGIRPQRRAGVPDIDGDLVGRQRAQRAQSRAGCRDRRTCVTRPATRSFLRIPSASAARSSLSTALAGRRTNSAPSGGGFFLAYPKDISKYLASTGSQQPAALARPALALTLSQRTGRGYRSGGTGVGAERGVFRRRELRAQLFEIAQRLALGLVDPGGRRQLGGARQLGQRAQIGLEARDASPARPPWRVGRRRAGSTTARASIATGAGVPRLTGAPRPARATDSAEQAAHAGPCAAPGCRAPARTAAPARWLSARSPGPTVRLGFIAISTAPKRRPAITSGISARAGTPSLSSVKQRRGDRLGVGADHAPGRRAAASSSR